jgi:phospho-N-acetylmuramoyl-pentapeptide-transferase
VSPKIIAILYRRGMRDQVRTYDENFSASKSGTPTMGGLILIGAVMISVVLWCNPLPYASKAYGTLPSPIPLLVMTLLFFGGIGALDDVLKVRRRGADAGLSRRVKLGLQVSYAILFSILISSDGTSPFPEAVRTILYLPGIPANAISPPTLGILFIPFVVLTFVCISNAINFADGLDGLAIVPSACVVLVFGVFAHIFSHEMLARITASPHLPHLTEVAVFAGAFVGAALGFLWFNSYPAQVFMGDTGSLAIGGTCAAMAVITKCELIFLIAGGIFVYEFVSVFIQDAIGIRRIGRRLLFRAPAHHGFQHLGIAETKVVLRFWIVSVLLAIISIATLKLH